MSVACVEHDAAAVTKNGQLYTWRFHTDNNANKTPPLAGERVDLPPVAQVAIGGIFQSHFAAVCQNGTMWTWGQAGRGQTGLGLGGMITGHVQAPREIPLALFGGCKVVNVTCGYDYTVVVTELGSVYSFGDNTHGQLGHGDSGVLATRHSPTRVEALNGRHITMCATARYHTLCVCSKGCVWSWGLNYSGQLGIEGADYADDVAVPTPVTGFDKPSTVVFLSTSPSHSMAVTSDGNLLAWGSNRYGQCGFGGVDILKTQTPVYLLDVVDAKRSKHKGTDTGKGKGKGKGKGTGNSGGHDVDDDSTPRAEGKQDATTPATRIRVKTAHCSHVQTVVLTENGDCWWTGIGSVGSMHNPVTFTRINEPTFANSRVVTVCVTHWEWLMCTDDGLVYTWAEASREGHPTHKLDPNPVMIQPEFFGGQQVGLYAKLSTPMMLAFAMGTHPRLGGVKSGDHTPANRRSSRKTAASVHADNISCPFVDMSDDLLFRIHATYALSGVEQTPGVVRLLGGAMCA